MPYTPQIRRTKVTQNNFGGQVTDGNRIAMSSANTFVTQDATGTPQTSPLTVNTTSTIALPRNATRITIASVTNPVQVSEDSSQTAFFTLPAGVPWTFDCADMTAIYLKTASSTVVSFLISQV